tara:strand:+ start:140 stop:337 length:198 start_codon:yes stop_codon:yes gene_type:complete
MRIYQKLGQLKADLGMSNKYELGKLVLTLTAFLVLLYQYNNLLAHLTYQLVETLITQSFQSDRTG